MFRPPAVTDLAVVWIDLAGKVCLARFRQHPRGPNKRSPPRQVEPKHSHPATTP